MHRKKDIFENFIDKNERYLYLSRSMSEVV